MVSYKTSHEIARMREAGHVVADTLQRVAQAAEPGVPLRELEAIAARNIKEHNAKPSFLNYLPLSAATPYPATVCLSVNEVVVHGIPTQRTLKNGDLLSIDCGAIVGGYHADAAITVPIGTIDQEAVRLLTTTEQALKTAIAAAQPGGRLGDLSHAVEQTGRQAGYGILEGCGGHGIGTEMHEPPYLPNTGRPGRGMRLKEGFTVAIEPMFHEGGRDESRTLRDGWSIATADGSRSAHFEHTVAITDEGPVVLTVL